MGVPCSLSCMPSSHFSFPTCPSTSPHRSKEDPLDVVNQRERQAFLSGRKRVALVSFADTELHGATAAGTATATTAGGTAAGTGVSLHADRRADDQVKEGTGRMRGGGEGDREGECRERSDVLGWMDGCVIQRRCESH